AIYLPGVSLIPIQRPLVSTLFPYTTLFRSLCGQTPGWAHLPRPEFPAAAWRQHVERRRPGAKHRAGRGPHNGRPTARIATRDHDLTADRARRTAAAATAAGGRRPRRHLQRAGPLPGHT